MSPQIFKWDIQCVLFFSLKGQSNPSPNPQQLY